MFGLQFSDTDVEVILSDCRVTDENKWTSNASVKTKKYGEWEYPTSYISSSKVEKVS